jgi:hypothetical protein
MEKWGPRNYIAIMLRLFDIKLHEHTTSHRKMCKELSYMVVFRLLKWVLYIQKLNLFIILYSILIIMLKNNQRVIFLHFYIKKRTNKYRTELMLRVFFNNLPPIQYGYFFKTFVNSTGKHLNFDMVFMNSNFFSKFLEGT